MVSISLFKHEQLKLIPKHHLTSLDSECITQIIFCKNTWYIHIHTHTHTQYINKNQCIIRIIVIHCYNKHETKWLQSFSTLTWKWPQTSIHNTHEFIWDLRFSQCRILRLLSSRMCSLVGGYQHFRRYATIFIMVSNMSDFHRGINYWHLSRHKWITNFQKEIWGFHSSDCEDYCIVGCDNV